MCTKTFGMKEKGLEKKAIPLVQLAYQTTIHEKELTDDRCGYLLDYTVRHG